MTRAPDPHDHATTHERDDALLRADRAEGRARSAEDALEVAQDELEAARAQVWNLSKHSAWLHRRWHVAEERAKRLEAGKGRAW